MRDVNRQFVEWFRAASPYIHVHRGQTMVLCFAGEAVLDPNFPALIHDIALLTSLGVRVVLVHGARPQIDACLRAAGIETTYVRGLRVTDAAALHCVKAAAGAVRVEIEALLSTGIVNSPMAGAHVRVASGNFVTAMPIGVLDGIDFQHTGEVRRVDGAGIDSRLAAGDLVLVPHIGYSPTGEVFNLSYHDVATAIAIELRARKLVFLLEGEGIRDASGEVLAQFTDQEAEQWIARQSPERVPAELPCAIRAAGAGVRRVHLVPRAVDGALLLELFSRDGIGTMVSDDPFDHLRHASIEDVGGILELIRPLEAEGALVRRSREKLEREIERFIVLARDGAVIACAALYPYPQEQVAEIACLAVHPAYRNRGYGDTLFDNLEEQARAAGLRQLFVLTTQTAHWFQERGFLEASVESLPVAKRRLYNLQRNSKVFVKPVGPAAVDLDL